MAARKPKYGETLHFRTGKQWKRNCETLCQCKSQKCRTWYEVGISGTLGRWGKQIKERMEALFKHPLPRNRSSNKKHLYNIKFILADRAGIGKKCPSPKDQVGFPVQAHHLLSSSKIFKDDKIKEFALAAAYDVNNGWNCILLPHNFGRQKWDDLQRHLGNHDKEIYYNRIQRKLKQVIKGYSKSDFCEKKKMEELHKNFHKAEEETFKKFQKNSIWLYYYAKAAFQMDYRSELGNGKDKYTEWVQSGCNRVVRQGAVNNNWYASRRYPIL